MTAAKTRNQTVAESVAALEAKVENGALRDEQAREKFGKIFDGMEEIRRDVADIKTEQATQHGQVMLAISELKQDVAVQKDRYERNMTWTAIRWSAIIGLLILVIDKAWPW